MTGSGTLSDSGVHPSGVLGTRLVRPLALLAVAWAAACGGDGGTTEPEPAPQPNRPPVASGSIPAQTMTAGESATVGVGGLFSDPDGDALTLTAISSNAGVASVALSGTNLTITAVAAGSATVTVTARDPAGLSVAASANVTVMEPNRAPVPAVPVAPAQTAIVGDTLNVDVSPFFSDPDGDALTYTAESGNTSIATVTVAGSVVSAAAVGPGSTTLAVTATDPDGLSGSLSVPVTVEPNRPPEAIQDSLPLQTIQERNSEAVNVAQYFTDPNGQALTYTAESDDPAVAAVSVSGSTMTVTAVAIGTATVTVTATDPYNLTASLSGTVEVIERVNQAPEAQSGVSDISRSVGWSGTLELEDDLPLFVDPDGDELTYSASSSDPGVVAVTVAGTVLRVATLAEGTATGKVTATDPGGLSASVSFQVTVLPGADVIFRDDFDDEDSLEDWTLSDQAVAEVADGMLQLTNDTTGFWAIAGRGMDPPVTSWEVRARLGASADSMATALAFAPTNPGELEFLLYRLRIGRVTISIDGEQQAVNYLFQAYFTPPDREAGWYYFGDLSGMSDAVNDGAGGFTEITVRVRDGIFEALAGDETLFSISVTGTRFASSLPEINEVHFWSIDDAAANPSLLDWIEVSGVPVEGSSAKAGADTYRAVVPMGVTRDAGAVREASPRIVGEAPPRVVGEGPPRSLPTPGRR